MSPEGEPKTVELPEKPPEAPAPEKMTLEQAQKEGWSDKEIATAEETGMLAKTGEKPPEGGKPPETPPSPEGEPPKPPEPEPESKGPKREVFDLSEEEEGKFNESFGKGHNVNGLYFGLKAQRSRAQAAEAERDRLVSDSKAKDEQIRTLSEQKAAPVKQEEEPEEERPMTRKELRETMAQIDADKVEAERKTAEQTKVIQENINQALTSQENNARSKYEHFDQAVKLSKALFDKDRKTGEFTDAKNILTLPEHTRKKAMLLVRSIANATAHADEMKSSDYNSADMLYELGQLHPDFGKPQGTAGQSAENNGKPPERTRGGLTPEDVARVEKNSARRGSSAGVSGSGGRRVVSVEDVTADDLTDMDDKTFAAFEKENPDKVKELLRS